MCALLTPCSILPFSSHSVNFFQGWLTCPSFQIVIAVRKTALRTWSSIQLNIVQIYFIPSYSWGDNNSGHLLHFARKPKAAIIHISTDLNLNRQSWSRPCFYKSIRLIRAKRAVPVAFLWSFSKKSGSRWSCLNHAEALWQTLLLSMHSLCLCIIHFSGLSPCFC